MKRSLRTTTAPGSFAHVVNQTLRRVLEAAPESVEAPAMRSAVRLTQRALRNDMRRDDPELFRALPDRIEATEQAVEALRQRQFRQCHRALRQVWSI